MIALSKGEKAIKKELCGKGPLTRYPEVDSGHQCEGDEV